MREKYFIEAKEESTFILDNFNSYVTMMLVVGGQEANRELNRHEMLIYLYSFIQAHYLKGDKLYLGNEEAKEREFFIAMRKLRGFVHPDFDKKYCSWIKLLADGDGNRIIEQKDDGSPYYVAVHSARKNIVRDSWFGLRAGEKILAVDGVPIINDGKYVTTKN